MRSLPNKRIDSIRPAIIKTTLNSLANLGLGLTLDRSVVHRIPEFIICSGFFKPLMCYSMHDQRSTFFNHVFQCRNKFRLLCQGETDIHLRKNIIRNKCHLEWNVLTVQVISDLFQDFRFNQGMNILDTQQGQMSFDMVLIENIMQNICKHQKTPPFDGIICGNICEEPKVSTASYRIGNPIFPITRPANNLTSSLSGDPDHVHPRVLFFQHPILVKDVLILILDCGKILQPQFIRKRLAAQ